VLDRAGVQATAREVLFRGADRGQVDGQGERVHFERSLPVDLLGQAGALLAYAMNGEELSAQHGYPLRLVVPGWYAVASVKWLARIELIAQPFRGHFQADRYHINGEPLFLQRVRSLIIEPAPGTTAEPGDITVRGVAWSGVAPIARVDVSIGSAPWRPATLVGEPRRHSWQWWELPAHLAGPASVTIRARATDMAGRTQPDQPRWNRLGYANNAVHEVRLAVAGSSGSSGSARELTVAKLSRGPCRRSGCSGPGMRPSPQRSARSCAWPLLGRPPRPGATPARRRPPGAAE